MSDWCRSADSHDPINRADGCRAHLACRDRIRVQEIIDAIEGTRAVGKSTAGALRLTLQKSAYKIVVAPVLADFQARYPEVCLDLSINEGPVDIVKEGLYAGFRTGDRLITDMIAVRLTGPLTPCRCAASAYLEAFGRPMHPRDLLNHKCIRYKSVTAKRIRGRKFIEDGQTKIVGSPTRLVFDSMQFVTQAALDGHGVGWSLQAVIEEKLKAGTLETVLDPYVTEMPALYLYYPEQNRRLEALRLFIGFPVSKRDSHAVPLL